MNVKTGLRWCLATTIGAGFVAGTVTVLAAEEGFADLVKRTQADKPKFAERQQSELANGYDLSDKPVAGVTMTRGKPVQGGVRVKLPAGVTWEQLAAMSPEEIKTNNRWPEGFFPLPHPHHEAGGMIFPKDQIDGIKKQDERD